MHRVQPGLQRCPCTWDIGQGFILTTILGIVGAFLATFIGQTVGWYRLDQGAGLIGAVIGAVVVLFIWHRLVARGVIQDPGSRRWL